ncbi:MAG: tRNA 2-thiouridine(34) synthase MnmA [Candidatus Moranbacteria bacterium]|nr:tRNA 2-thiouridine(34) synthase MnmA [Candidatus Moranbacteria bacterium]
MKQKIAIGMSGGVDSSVSALLLKEAGFDVSGFFMKFWSDNSCDSKRENSCCNAESIKMAGKVAQNIGIPFYVVDVQKLFKEIVVDDFIKEYADLRTPNPCVGCNKFIKFGWFMELARNAGFDKIATGHYVRIEKDEAGTFHLLSGEDATKDQSYFLHRLNQEQLSNIVFPVGGMIKKDVMEIAKKNGMDFENKKESQEVCFVQDKNYKDFLARHLKSEYFSSGSVIDRDGKIVGKHDGLIGYTIGQRKGIEYSGIKNDNREPLYVAGFDKEKNNLIVGTEKDIYSKSFLIGNVSWISESAKKAAFGSKDLKVKIRYRHTAVACSVEYDKGDESKIRVALNVPQKAVTPGQYAVFYAGNEVLGGGVIGG